MDGASEQTISFKILKGSAMEEVSERLAELRIEVFREFPYLYEGTAAYELSYLQTYFKSERSMAVLALLGDKIIGASTCIPLSDETDEVQKPFLAAGIPMTECFYFGESVLQKEWRGRGIGLRFFEERELHAQSFGQYKSMWFCAVERATNHPYRPAEHLPLDVFWKKRGFEPVPEMVSYFEWKELGEEMASPKKMNYWKKLI